MLPIILPMRKSVFKHKLTHSHSPFMLEMEGREHFTHQHPLVLCKYNYAPTDAESESDSDADADALCYGCQGPILINTDVYHCIHQPNTSQNSPCAYFFLHKTCADLPIIIQHHLHTQHVLTLKSNFQWTYRCHSCDKYFRHYWVYICTRQCSFAVCFKCAFLERELTHPSHYHTLTLLPLIALHVCTACGTEGTKDFSYLCKTCFFWIHKTCASAPASLIRKDHHNDHPLVLAYSLPQGYQKFGVSCSLCPETVHSFYWLYYCAGCRYFAHIQCALSAAESSKDDDEDVEGSNLAHFPVSDNELYLLIREFAKKFSISTEEKSGKADKISQCRNGHSLILFDNFNNKSVVETNTSEERICNGCVHPLLSPPDPYYGCLDCNFFLHSVCAAELAREIEHYASSHSKKEVTRLTRFYQTSKPYKFYICKLCDKYSNGILYSDESSKYQVDIVCAALPSKINHNSHRHTLHQSSDTGYYNKCRGCGLNLSAGSFGCKICDYYIHIQCALKKGRIKHRWDEHQLILMYPPVKGHPHDFNCELCSEDINPNYWFYHCPECDTSFHTKCIDEDEYSNIKCGGIVKDDQMHQHSLQLTGSRNKFQCDSCGDDRCTNYGWEPRFKCVPCKISVCIDCVYLLAE